MKLGAYFKRPIIAVVLHDALEITGHISQEIRNVFLVLNVEWLAKSETER